MANEAVGLGSPFERSWRALKGCRGLEARASELGTHKTVAAALCKTSSRASQFMYLLMSMMYMYNTCTCACVRMCVCTYMQM